MNFLTGLVNNIKEINSATLTGAIDIVIVEQEDGTFRSTPFHVRFGKLGAVWCDDKDLEVEVNGQEVEELAMTLDPRGKAFFRNWAQNETRSHKEYDREKKEQSFRRQRSRHLSDPQEILTRGEETHDHVIRPLTHETQGSRRGSMHRAASNSDLEAIIDEVITKKKTSLNITREKLDQYNLRFGCNEISFSLTTQFQGTTRCSCNAFVWAKSEKVVISDIDGTITRSDVRGMILPMIGINDWAQGEVTSLFSKIYSNGYKILYLSARSISQAAETKSYLLSLNQCDCKLPPGPLFLNPESALRSFKREVIDKEPEIFKIHCLSNLKELFLQNPYFAGYGNKPTDVTAYKEVGIPSSHIFIVNKIGNLKHQVCESVSTSYKEQGQMVDHYFPTVRTLRPASKNQFL